MSQPTVPIRLVALDLDGTLLTHQSGVSPLTRQAIAEAVSHGVVVLPATGRPLANLPPVVAQLPGSNGASVWDLGSDPLGCVYSRYSNAAERETSDPVCLIRNVFPVQKAREVFALFQEYNGELSVFSEGYSLKDEHGIRCLTARFAKRKSTEANQPDDGRFLVVRDFAEWMSRHAHEVEKFCMFFETREEAQAVLPRFLALKDVEVVQGCPENIEGTPRGIDKGSALLTLADRLGIPREATAAIGDSENDRTMLEKAGVAAVMANGMPQIKALADLVSENDCDHDGIAELFRRLNL